MAKKILQNYDFNCNEIQNVKLQVLATDPTESAVEGRFIYNSTNKVVKVHNGTSWTKVGAGVESVAVKTGETAIAIDTTDTANPKFGFNICGTQGTGVTVTKETGDDPGLKVSVQDGTTSVKGIVQLSSTPSSTAEGLAATPKGANVTIEEQEIAEEGYLKTYVIKQGGTALATKINIPKDFLVKSAKVVTAVNYAPNTAYAKGDILINGTASYVVQAAITAAENTQFSDVSTQSLTGTFNAGDKVIVFVVNVKSGTATDEFIVLNAKDLVDIYTAGDGIAISASNVVSINNSITAQATSAVYPVTLTAQGLVNAYGNAQKIVKSATGTIAIGNTSASVVIPTGADFICASAFDATTNEELGVDITIIKATASAAGSVTFAISKAYTNIINLLVIYKDVTVE